MSSLLSTAKQSLIPVFTIGLGVDADQSTLKSIALQTGGLFTYSPKSSDLSRIYSQVAAQLNGQIQLSYISVDPTDSNTHRHVKVVFHYGAFTGQNDYDYIR